MENFATEYPPARETNIQRLFSGCRMFFYFCFLIAHANITAPHANNIPDNNCPMVNPHDVKNPIWVSGARKNSHTTRNTAYNIPIIPVNAPGYFFKFVFV